MLGALCVGLGVVRSMWTFPTAIGSVTLLGIVVWRERLYSDALLQLFFVGANIYGWLNWRGARERSGAIVIETLGWVERGGWTIAIVLLSIAIGAVMARYTNAAYPLWDASITVASMAAQVLMAQRRWENWLLWVVVDVAAIWLYHVKQLETFAGLYVIYLMLSLWGLAQWLTVRRARGQGEEATPA